ncbi:MAG TPA: sodium:proton antiporter [Pseudohongiella sp.]|nr:sodium:proton antiporter [Pseudohongiella sp.]|tara:strand:- start:1998 stop:2522 length:525 start_codon:yes stop_codon:yes gene_type:complete
MAASRGKRSENSQQHGLRTVRVLLWALVYTATWTLLSSGQGWYIGIPVICLATGLSYILQPPSLAFRLQHLPGFIAYFVSRQLLGGMDVAKRSFQRDATSHAAWVHYPFTSAALNTRIGLSALIGLLPGTLGARIESDALLIHVLDERLDWKSEVANLERHLSKLLGTPARTSS